MYHDELVTARTIDIGDKEEVQGLLDEVDNLTVYGLLSLEMRAYILNILLDRKLDAQG